MPAASAEARFSLRLADEAATARLAEDIGAVLQPGDLVALSGGLGVGKTTLARALLRALAADPAREVPSPTFPLRIDHAFPRFDVVHADLYRLTHTDELAEIGLDEALSDSAVLVEWPEQLAPDLTANRLDLTLALAGAGRHAEITATGTWPARLERSRTVRAFLERSGWAAATRQPHAGDASYRTHERILRGASTAMLMNAPARAPGPAIHDGRTYDAVAHRATDICAFLAIAAALRERGVHAPEILAADVDAGLLLAEDLGSEGIVDPDGAPIMARYEAALDLLAFMHGQSWPETVPLADGASYSLPPYDRDALLIEVSLFPDWFGGHGGEPAFPPEEREPFLAAWSNVVAHVADAPATWVLRDFHSPNILWQAEATGLDRVGVIDFQDALIGHPAYDVASLAQDARVPLSEAQETSLKARYISARTAASPGFDVAAFEAGYAVMGLQRATKVLGIFTRLALAEGKPGYQRHRAWLKTVIHRNLAHPVLSNLRLWYEPYL